jgi:hypothetical protein
MCFVCILGSIDKLVAVAACAGLSLKDKLNAGSAEKAGSYSVRSANRQGGNGTMAAAASKVNGPIAGDNKSANNAMRPPGRDLRALGSTAPIQSIMAAPKEQGAMAQGDEEIRSPAQDQLCEYKRCKQASRYCQV